MLIIRPISEDDLWYLKVFWKLMNESKSASEGVFLGPTSIFGKFFIDLRKMMIIFKKNLSFF